MWLIISKIKRILKSFFWKIDLSLRGDYLSVLLAKFTTLWCTYFQKPYQWETEKSTVYTEVFFGTEVDMVNDAKVMN